MRKFFRSENGQIFLWLALAVPLLILFAAMALDMGLIYKTKAQLSNSVDAAVLTGIKNYSLGTATAQTLGSDVFWANFGTQCGSNGVTCTWTWCPGGAGCLAGVTNVTLHATTPHNTTFMAYLPQWAVWSLGDQAQAIRRTLVMSIVVDRSGSMVSSGSGGDGGGPALQVAVPNFVADFTQGSDYLGLISFASDARVDVPITNEFVTPINTAIGNMVFNGGTFGTGAGSNSYDTAHGPPMSLADNQNTTTGNGLPAGTPYTKVTVYFTDGLMNTIQDTFTCTNNGLGNQVFNYGGYDSGTTYDFMDPLGNFEGSSDIWPYDDYSAVYGCGGSLSCSPTGGQCGYGLTGQNYPTCNGPNSNEIPTNLAPNYCTYANSGNFPSQKYGGWKGLSRANITEETQYRATTTAAAMQAETPVATYFYVIGLSTAVTAPVRQFLATIANDPTGQWGNVYNSNLPMGYFYYVPDCPSAQCTAELNAAFQEIASNVLLRLSQ